MDLTAEQSIYRQSPHLLDLVQAAQDLCKPMNSPQGPVGLRNRLLST
jgi:hypothetical protein